MEEIEVVVTSVLPFNEPQGRFQIRISPDATVQTLLIDLCKEAYTPVKSKYILRNKGHGLLLRNETLREAGLEDGALLHWTSEGAFKSNYNKLSSFWFLAAIAFLIGISGISAICYIRYQETEAITDYAIVFDAGSSHTSMFIYKWEGSKFHGTALASQQGEQCRAQGGGISSYVSSPQSAGESLEPCLSQAQATIPRHKHSATPVYLGATAGMRLLNLSNPDASKAILNSVVKTLSESGFQFNNFSGAARILSGSEEGSFSWITSNYIANAFDVERPGVGGTPAQLIVPSVGALDLGGASTQITFLADDSTDIPEGFSYKVKLYDTNYTVYTHSFLCYGVNEINKVILGALYKPNQTVIDHPCLPYGFNLTETYQEIFESPCVQRSLNSDLIKTKRDDLKMNDNITYVGQSNQDACSDIVKSTLFKNTSCPFSSCSFNGIYQPPLHNAGPFFAFSSFYYTAAFLNLTRNSSSTQYTDFRDAVKSLCNMTFKELEDIPVSEKEEEVLPYYCLDSVYIQMILHDGYNFTESIWPDLNFESKIANVEVGWTLGFVLNESNNYPVDLPEVAMETLTFILLMVLFILFILVSFALAAQSKKKRVRSRSYYEKMDSYGAI